MYYYEVKTIYLYICLLDLPTNLKQCLHSSKMRKTTTFFVHFKSAGKNLFYQI